MQRRSRRFLDTNILLHYLTRDDEVKASACLDLLFRVEQGEEQIVTSPMIIFETVFTLQRRYRQSRERVAELILPIIQLRGLRLREKHIYERALAIYASVGVSFADAFNAAYMEAQGISEIYSYDHDFDHLPNTTRLEPLYSS